MKNILKYLWVGVSFCLVAMITFCVFFQPKHQRFVVKLKPKSLKTTTFTKLVQARVVPVAVPEPEPEPVPTPVVQEPPKLDVVETPSLDTQVGTMSAYGPDCAGCSGGMACGGFNAAGGNYIYNDATYGNVRVVAGDRQYKCGSIVKVSGSKLGDFNAIVLDRGGGIGFGKRFLFDLLFASEAEASQFGTSYDVTFSLLRDGY